MAGKKKDQGSPSLLLTLILVMIIAGLIFKYSYVRDDSIYPVLPKNYDLIVIGSGIAGDLTAVSAAENGADVLYLDTGSQKQVPFPYLPVFWAARTSLQQEAESNYLPETMAVEIFRRSAELGNYAQILNVSLQSANALQWLQDMTGLDLQLDGANPALHVFTPEAFNELPAKIRAQADRLVIERSSLEPLRLLLEENAVRGVVVRHADGRQEEILARAVILADGSYGASLRLLKDWAGLEGVPPRIDGGQSGLGLRLAREIGAKTVQLSQANLVTISLVNGGRVSLPSDGEVLLYNQEGQLLGQTAPYEELLRQQHGKLLFVYSAEKLPAALPAVDAEDPLQLAELLGSDPSLVISQTALLTTPYKVVTLGLVAVMPGGLSVTEHYQAEGNEGPITGLYAAGEGTAGLHGDHINDDLLFAETVISAMLAGQHAAVYALR